MESNTGAFPASRQRYRVRKRPAGVRLRKVLVFLISLPVILWLYFDREARFEIAVKEPMNQFILQFASTSEEQKFLSSTFEEAHKNCFEKNSKRGSRRRAPRVNEKNYFRELLETIGKIAAADGRVALAHQLIQTSQNTDLIFALFEGGSIGRD